jgi:hypothetical protein
MTREQKLTECLKELTDEVIRGQYGELKGDFITRIQRMAREARALLAEADQKQDSGSLEMDADLYFHQHRITMNGVGAGEYLDKEDFMIYARYLNSLSKNHEAEKEVPVREGDIPAEYFTFGKFGEWLLGQPTGFIQAYYDGQITISEMVAEYPPVKYSKAAPVTDPTPEVSELEKAKRRLPYIHSGGEMKPKLAPDANAEGFAYGVLDSLIGLYESIINFRDKNQPEVSMPEKQHAVNILNASITQSKKTIDFYKIKPTPSTEDRSLLSDPNTFTTQPHYGNLVKDEKGNLVPAPWMAIAGQDGTLPTFDITQTTSLQTEQEEFKEGEEIQNANNLADELSYAYGQIIELDKIRVLADKYLKAHAYNLREREDLEKAVNSYDNEVPERFNISTPSTEDRSLLEGEKYKKLRDGIIDFLKWVNEYSSDSHITRRAKNFIKNMNHES